ncbi:MAG: cytochrome c biogenesis protein ResB [Spirochaetales bacterium]
MKGLSDKIYDALRSVKLAAALIVLIAILAAAGGIIPQGRTIQFYTQRFPGTAEKLILALGLDKIFTGLPFLALASLFTVNLTICSFHRFANEMRKPRANRRHGPDLLHIGLLIFIFGGILSSRTRTEAFIYLGKGQAARLPDGALLTLVDLREERYPDGRPKSWESSVVIDDKAATSLTGVVTPAESGGDTLGESGYTGEDPRIAAGGKAPQVPTSPGSGGVTTASTALAHEAGALAQPTEVRVIKVNNPLRHKGSTIYQQDWNSELRVVLEDAMGIKLRLEPGTLAPMLGGSVRFMTVEKHEPSQAGAEECSNYKAVFLVSTAAGKEILRAGKGDKVGTFTFSSFEEAPVSGLKIVRDKGYPLVAAGLGLIVLGTFLTYIRKLKGMFA